jgi:hypothetical protein
MIFCVIFRFEIIFSQTVLLEKFKFSWLKTENEKKYAREPESERKIDEFC